MRNFLLAVSVAMSWSLVARAQTVYDVRALGAKGDGRTDDTAVLQKALDDCGKSGGTVRLPKGSYYSKPLTIKTRTTLLLEAGATLLAST